MLVKRRNTQKERINSVSGIVADRTNTPTLDLTWNVLGLVASETRET
jgi:hypothetical protein